MADFFDMGGYAMYVWPAFGVSFTALAVLYWLTRNSLRKATQRTHRYVLAMQEDSA